ncbi:hypothetical protein OEZ86_003867 [Tetradesmus obliquus]|nr:hypothetical protein OEZ86_003867 [Tetradesmus obliquus]
MRLHYSRSQALPRIKSRVNLLLGDCGGWRPVIVRLWKYAFVAKIAVLLLLPLLVAFMPADAGSSTGNPAAAARLAALSSHLRSVAGGGSSDPGHHAFNSAAQYAAAGISKLNLEATTKEPLPAVLHLAITHQTATAAATAAAAAEPPAAANPAAEEPDEQQSNAADVGNSSSGRAALCARMSCSTASNCTASDPACCAYLQLRMLAFWDRFMASKGLAQQHFLVYNSLLAAVQRSQTLDAESKVVRCKSPGRAHCQLSYPREEKVLEVEVLDKVKAARQEVLEHYKADFLGVRGPNWINSSFVPDSKYTRAASDEHLANQVLPSSFVPADLRSTKLQASCTYDKERYHAFTRGEVTTGWNHSTQLTCQEQRQWQQRLDGKAATATMKRTGELKSYVTPTQRQAALSTSLRSAKEAAVQQQASLVQKYGPEGAAAMATILAMPVPDRPPVAIKASHEDLAAVQELPALGLADP